MGIGFGNHPQMALFHSISGLFNVSRIGERNDFGWTMTIGGLLSTPQLERMPKTMTPQSWFARHWHWVYMGLPHHTLW